MPDSGYCWPGRWLAWTIGCSDFPYGYRGGAVSSHWNGQTLGVQVQNVVRSYFIYFVHVLNKQVLSTLEKPTVAEVLLCGARVVINMSLCWKRCEGEDRTEVAHSKVREHGDRAKAVIFFRTTVAIEFYKQVIT